MSRWQEIMFFIIKNSGHILLRLLHPIKQIFLSEINRTLPKNLFSRATSCVSPAYQSVKNFGHHKGDPYSNF